MNDHRTLATDIKDTVASMSTCQRDIERLAMSGSPTLITIERATDAAREQARLGRILLAQLRGVK